MVIQGLEVTLGVVVEDTGQVHAAQDVPETNIQELGEWRQLDIPRFECFCF